MRAHSRSIIVVVLVVVSMFMTSSGAAVASPLPPSSDASPRWRWPVEGARAVIAPYRAPAHTYGAGHRGVDIGAAAGAGVFAPADGVVAFRGSVVDRPLLTIEHDDGLVTTFEPLRSALTPGDKVSAGQEIGSVDAGGHAPSGALHLGVRRDGAYINPMLLLGDVPRAVLLPCCGAT